MAHAALPSLTEGNVSADRLPGETGARGRDGSAHARAVTRSWNLTCGWRIGCFCFGSAGGRDGRRAVADGACLSVRQKVQRNGTMALVVSEAVLKRNCDADLQICTRMTHNAHARSCYSASTSVTRLVTVARHVCNLGRRCEKAAGARQQRFAAYKVAM